MTWHEAFAYCIWNGWRIPTEAEWEFAAAGGNENRLYPWGKAAPNNTRAVYDCLYFGTSSCTFEDIAPVGSLPAGTARWGHMNLAGSMLEWTLDWYDSTWYTGQGNVCNNCYNSTSAIARAARGGVFESYAESLRAVFRGENSPTYEGKDS
jgi:formylglycine-generating enzyme